jgi:hypothetical protein
MRKTTMHNILKGWLTLPGEIISVCVGIAVLLWIVSKLGAVLMTGAMLLAIWLLIKLMA